VLAWYLSCAWLVLLFVFVGARTRGDRGYVCAFCSCCFSRTLCTFVEGTEQDKQAAHGMWTSSEAGSVETAGACSKAGMTRSNRGKVVEPAVLQPSGSHGRRAPSSNGDLMKLNTGLSSA
jgi:hypothetical protein